MQIPTCDRRPEDFKSKQLEAAATWAPKNRSTLTQQHEMHWAVQHVAWSRMKLNMATCDNPRSPIFVRTTSSEVATSDTACGSLSPSNAPTSSCLCQLWEALTHTGNNSCWLHALWPCSLANKQQERKQTNHYLWGKRCFGGPSSTWFLISDIQIQPKLEGCKQKRVTWVISSKNLQESLNYNLSTSADPVL